MAAPHGRREPGPRQAERRQRDVAVPSAGNGQPVPAARPWHTVTPAYPDDAAGGCDDVRAPGRRRARRGGQAPLDVAVIGGGQAGLAIGHLLADQGRRLAIFEAGPAVGSAWRGRWDSLVLFTPRRYDALPGMTFPGEPDGHPDRDEVVAYLEAYARRFALPVVTDHPVRTLRAREGGGFVLGSERGDVEAAQVVVATGPFQAPHTPEFAAGLDPEVVQIHSTGYRRPSDVPAGRVLVVGGGNTGFQIAEDLAPTHEVALAIGTRQTPLPQRLLGRDLFWWLTRTGVLAKTVDSRIGRRARGRDTLIGSSRRRLRRRGVTLHPRVVGASGRTVTLRRWGRRDAGRGRLGHGLPPRPLLDRSARDRRRRPPAATGGASRMSPASTSSASRGSTPAARRSSASSRTTPASSPGASTSTPARPRTPDPDRRPRRRRCDDERAALQRVSDRPRRPARRGRARDGRPGRRRVVRDPDRARLQAPRRPRPSGCSPTTARSRDRRCG